MTLIRDWTAWEKEIEQAAKDLGVVLERKMPIQPGDMYLAKRNGPPQLLTAREIKDNYIVPEEFPAYCFDVWECVRIGADELL